MLLAQKIESYIILGIYDIKEFINLKRSKNPYKIIPAQANQETVMATKVLEQFRGIRSKSIYDKTTTLQNIAANSSLIEIKY